MGEQDIIIAIDGYSSCGKSTLAKALAKRMGYAYIDTGAMYRAVTWYVMQHDIDVNDTQAVINALPDIHISFKLNGNGGNRTILNDQDVEEAIRSMEVSNQVSEVSRIKEVRENLVAQQQRMGQDKAIVMDGRDIGTVVFPHAELKLFMTADMDVRIERRYEELRAKGLDVTVADVARNLQERDRIDTTRKESPLRKADDAIEIDNTHLTPQQQLDLAALYVRRKLTGEEE